MLIAIATFEGFNELDSFVASAILNRVKLPGWKAEIICPSESVVSMNGVTVTAQKPLTFAKEADVVLFGSGIHIRTIVQDEAIMSEFQPNPDRQLIGAQCSGSLFLHKLGLIDNLPVCADAKTRPYLEDLGLSVLDEPFTADGKIATAGGCLSSYYLSVWVIWYGAGIEAAKEVIYSVASVGQKDEYLSRALEVVGRFFNLNSTYREVVENNT